MDIPNLPLQDASVLQAELRLEIARLEKRMTKWTVICAMGATSVALLWTMVVTLHGHAWPALGLFVLGSAGQLYAVSRM